MSGTLTDYAFFHAYLEGFLSVDQANHSTNSNIRYFGFEAGNGRWYIIEQTTDGLTIAQRYAQSTGGYALAWAARELGSYELPSVTWA